MTEIARVFARRLRANADHAEKQKFSVANLSTMSVADCRALADWIDEGVVSGGQRTHVPSDWRRFWIVVSEVGLVPEKKGPFPMARTAEVIREFIAARPRARLICLTVDDSGTPHVDHAPQVLQMLDGRSMSSARKHNERVRSAEAQEGANAEHGKGLSDSGKDVSGNRERVVNATPAGAGDLVERLGNQVSAIKKWITRHGGIERSFAISLCASIAEAASRIEALEAEVASLQTRLTFAYGAKVRCNDDAIYERHRATTAEADLAALRAEVERKDKALREIGEAIAEYFRYLNGGEMRGSYDGKPEREGLRKAGYAVSRALAPAKAGG